SAAGKTIGSETLLVRGMNLPPLSPPRLVETTGSSPSSPTDSFPVAAQGNRVERSGEVNRKKRMLAMIEQCPQTQLLLWHHANQFHPAFLLIRPADDGLRCHGFSHEIDPDPEILPLV